MKKTEYGSLDKSQRRLAAAAEAASQTAYCPYSRYAVGAALMTPGGRIITGSNVENAAYGSTICAERAALVRANAMGNRVFKSLAVAAPSSQGRQSRRNGRVAAPCGACRQMLYEASRIGRRDIEIILLSADRKTVVLTSIDELLPLGFEGGRRQRRTLLRRIGHGGQARKSERGVERRGLP